MTTNQYSEEVVKILNRLYFNSRGDISGMMQTHNVKIATQAINKLIVDARIDELKRTLEVAELTKKTPDYNTITWVDDLITVTKDRIKSLTNSKGSKAKT